MGSGAQTLLTLTLLFLIAALQLSFSLYDSHSRSLTVTQLFTARRAHHATTTFSLYDSHSHSHSRPLVLALTHSSTHFSSRSRLRKVSFISVFGCFYVGLFLCLVRKMLVNGTLCWCENSATALGSQFFFVIGISFLVFKNGYMHYCLLHGMYSTKLICIGLLLLGRHAYLFLIVTLIL